MVPSSAAEEPGLGLMGKAPGVSRSSLSATGARFESMGFDSDLLDCDRDGAREVALDPARELAFDRVGRIAERPVSSLPSEPTCESSSSSSAGPYSRLQ